MLEPRLSHLNHKCQHNYTRDRLVCLTMKSDRIRQTRMSRKLTQQQLGDRIGVTKATVSQWEKGDYSPSGQNLYNLAKALGVSAEWLLSGKGEPDKPLFQNVESTARQDDHKVPVLSYVQAGHWREAHEISDIDGGVEYITTDLELGEFAFSLRIQGDSMTPEFGEGDVVIIDPDVAPLPGDYVVAQNGHESTTFKKYRPRGYNDKGQDVFELVPLNDDYPTLRSDMSPIAIIGTMMEHRKYRKRR